jgi:uncharacterized membrane protein YdjX (TVP38/TMEM64 family)
MKKLSPQRWIALAALALLAAALVVAWRRGWLEIFLDRGALQALVGRFGAWGPLAFIAAQLLQVVVPFIPGQVTTMVGGALFGAGWAFVYSYIAVIAGGALAFAIARKLGRAVVRGLTGEAAYRRYFEVIQSQGALSRTRITLAAMLLLPFFPDDLLCLLAGLTPLPLWQFFVITVAARPWGLLFSAFLGDGALSIPLWGLGLICAASIGVGALVFRYAPAIEEKLFRRVKRALRAEAEADKPEEP